MGAERSRGIGRYIDELVRGLASEVSSTDDEVVVFVRDTQGLHDYGSGVTYQVVDVPWYSFREQFVMPWAFFRAKPDLIHVPHWNVPLLLPFVPLILTIHDLLLRHETARESAKASTRHPVYFWLKRLGYRVALWMALRRANAVTVPTKVVAQDVMRWYPWCAKAEVTGEGLTSLPSPRERLMSSPYLLYVGSAYPHKRVGLLLDAWKVLCKRRPELHLVITGEKDLFVQRLLSRVEQEVLVHVHFVGRLSDQDLATYYHHAEVFVFPSDHEGFGLPPLEAVSQGCPAVVSDIPCHQEVVTVPGVLFFRNGDRDDMIVKIEQVLDARTTFAAATVQGIQQLQVRHQWSQMAHKTLEVYRRVLQTVE